MQNSKRNSCSSSKNVKYNGKLKEILSSSSSSRGKSVEPKFADIKDFSNVPVIKQIDYGRLLPKYYSIITKNGDDKVTMEDLDQLQQDLEKLISTNALRSRFFFGEPSPSNQKEEKAHDKSSLKRKRPEDKSKNIDPKNFRSINREPFKPHIEKPFPEIYKITVPRNDNSEKFWATLEPYCSPITIEDATFLKSLIEEFSTEIDLKIPELSDHYSKSWTDEFFNDESLLKKDVKKNGTLDIFGGKQVQSCLAALIQEKTAKIKIPEGVINQKSGDISKIKQNVGQKNGACFEERLLNELMEQGILDHDDIHKTESDDEILSEVKKCQEEMLTINKYNLEELKTLHDTVLSEIEAIKIKEETEKRDREVLELYNNIMATRRS